MTEALLEVIQLIAVIALMYAAYAIGYENGYIDGWMECKDFATKHYQRFIDTIMEGRE
jgi:hypothetical protein